MNWFQIVQPSSLPLIAGIRFFSNLGMVACSFVMGCHDPRFEVKQAERDERIQMWLDDYRIREERRPEYIQMLGDIDQRLQKERAASLDLTLRYWKTQEQRSAATWKEQDSAFDMVLQRGLHGHPEVIPDVWARMVY